MTESEAEVYLEYMNDLLHSFKAKYRDPHIIVAGDWNRANTDVALEDFRAINAIPTPPTRGDEVLDIIFTNMRQSVEAVYVSPPLIPDAGGPGRPSDHNIVTVTFNLPRK